MVTVSANHAPTRGLWLNDTGISQSYPAFRFRFSLIPPPPLPLSRSRVVTYFPFRIPQQCIECDNNAILRKPRTVAQAVVENPTKSARHSTRTDDFNLPFPPNRFCGLPIFTKQPLMAYGFPLISFSLETERDTRYPKALFFIPLILGFRCSPPACRWSVVIRISLRDDGFIDVTIVSTSLSPVAALYRYLGYYNRFQQSLCIASTLNADRETNRQRFEAATVDPKSGMHLIHIVVSHWPVASNEQFGQICTAKRKRGNEREIERERERERGMKIARNPSVKGNKTFTGVYRMKIQSTGTINRSDFVYR